MLSSLPSSSSVAEHTVCRHSYQIYLLLLLHICEIRAPCTSALSSFSIIVDHCHYHLPCTRSHPRSLTPADGRRIVSMPWPGLTNFLMGRERPQPEDPYTTYIRKHCLENGERHRRGMQRVPHLEHEEWRQCNEQAIANWRDQVLHGHNRDLGTSYRSWDDLERASTDSYQRDQDDRESMRRARKRRREPHPFFGGPGQPRNRFEETDDEWYARIMDPNGKRRHTGDISGRHASHSDSANIGRLRGSGCSRRGGEGEGNRGATTGQARSQYDTDDGIGARAKGPGNGVWQQEAEAFLNPWEPAQAARSGSGEWSDEAEAEAFLNA